MVRKWSTITARPSLRSLAILMPALVLVQIALGAAFRHGAIGVMPHVIGAMVVSLAILIVCAFVLHQFPEHRALRPAAMALLAVTLVQVCWAWGRIYARLDAERAAPGDGHRHRGACGHRSLDSGGQHRAGDSDPAQRA